MNVFNTTEHHTLKKAKMVKFMFWAFYHDKKEEKKEIWVLTCPWPFWLSNFGKPTSQPQRFFVFCFLFFVVFGLFFFFTTPTACGSSRTRHQTQATAVTKPDLQPAKLQGNVLVSLSYLDFIVTINLNEIICVNIFHKLDGTTQVETIKEERVENPPWRINLPLNIAS